MWKREHKNASLRLLGWAYGQRSRIGAAVTLVVCAGIFYMVVSSFSNANGASPRRQVPAVPRASLPSSTAMPASVATRVPILGLTTEPLDSPTPTRPALDTAKRTYTVTPGDTPAAIAEKLAVPAADRAEWIRQLLALNNAAATALQIGQVLNLPDNTPAAPPQ